MNSPQSFTDYGGLVTRSAGRLDEDEAFILTHVDHFGSDGYPIRKVGRYHWTWSYRSKFGPGLLKTRKEAVRMFELHLDILRDKLAGIIA